MDLSSAALSLVRRRKPYPGMPWQRWLGLSQGGPRVLRDDVCASLALLAISLPALIAPVLLQVSPQAGALGMSIVFMTMGYVLLVALSAGLLSRPEVDQMATWMKRYPGLVQGCAHWFQGGELLRKRDMWRMRIAVGLLKWHEHRLTKATVVAAPPPPAPGSQNALIVQEIMQLKAAHQGSSFSLPADMTSAERERALRELDALARPAPQWPRVVQRLLQGPWVFFREFVSVGSIGTIGTTVPTAWDPRVKTPWIFVGAAIFAMTVMTLMVLDEMILGEYFQSSEWYPSTPAAKISCVVAEWVILMAMAIHSRTWSMPVAQGSLDRMKMALSDPLAAWVFDQRCQDPARFSQRDAFDVCRAQYVLRAYHHRKCVAQEYADTVEAIEELPAARAGRAMQQAEALDATTAQTSTASARTRL